MRLERKTRSRLRQAFEEGAPAVSGSDLLGKIVTGRARETFSLDRAAPLMSTTSIHLSRPRCGHLDGRSSRTLSRSSSTSLST